MNSKKQINEEKLYEYIELMKVVKESTNPNIFAKVCLKNNTLRTLAGYTKDSNQDNFNEYVKKFLDKLAYDEHNKKVQLAKKENNNEELKRLSREVMGMAGYINSEDSKQINEYAKSFVDRTLLDKQLSRLYKAMENGDNKVVDEVYKKIYTMTSYSDNRPYGVVNEYAQSFVDARMDKYIKKGIHTPAIDDEKYVI